MTYLLDTDHLSILQRRDSPERTAIVANINLHGEQTTTACVVSFHEQALGCNDRISQARARADLVRGYELLALVIDSFTAFHVFPFDTAAAAMFDAMRAAKVRISTMDLRIASVALSQNLVLVTRNVSDYGRVPGLRTEDWTK